MPAGDINDVRVLVIGDVHIDTILVPIPSSSEQESNSNDSSWRRYRHRGGAWLAHKMVTAATDFSGKRPTVVTYNELAKGVSDNDIQTGIDSRFDSWATLLGLFPHETRSDRQVYRIDRLLGSVHGSHEPDFDKRKATYMRSLKSSVRSISKIKEPFDIVLMHDRDGVFSELDWAGTEKVVLDKLAAPWLVWHIAGGFLDSRLWRAIEARKRWQSKTIAVVRGESMRQVGANLPDGISLEREAQNFLAAVRQIPLLKRLTGCVRHLIVHFPQQGVLHFDTKKGLATSCYYCPDIATSPNNPSRGTMAGYSMLLCAAVVRGMVWALQNSPRGSQDDKVAQGLIAGLKQSVVIDHRYFLNGFAFSGRLAETSSASTPFDETQLFSSLFEEMLRADYNQKDWRKYRLAALELPATSHQRPAALRDWSRIDGFARRRRRNTAHEAQLTTDDLVDMGYEIVKVGLEKSIQLAERASPTDETTTPMPGVPPVSIECPFEVYGDIKTADRREIEGFAAIRRIVQRYLNSPKWKHPLCLAVFGPPGSGKNFTLKEVIKGVDSKLAEWPLEFNIAQFKGLDDLKTVFHQVQDRTVSGEIPLVIFDEFDCTFDGRGKELGWLQYFLAPMQDGKFKAGESMYRIGRSIFVFVGGVCDTFEALRQKVEQKAFHQLKGKDFVSRLRGHLDILGINFGDSDGTTDNRLSARLVFRRAILLRSLIEKRLPTILRKDGSAEIERDVVNAFLQIDSYAHGARSMQAIVEMTKPSQQHTFQKASLPPFAQLNMHVAAGSFLALASSLDPNDELLHRQIETRTSRTAKRKKRKVTTVKQS